MRENRKSVNEKSNLLRFVSEVTKVTAEEKQENMGEWLQRQKMAYVVLLSIDMGVAGEETEKQCFLVKGCCQHDQ